MQSSHELTNEWPNNTLQNNAVRERHPMTTPTPAQQLLAATGNIWRVDCWHDGNRRKIVQTLYVRASDVLRAEAIGKRESGRR
jgi:hypothetical protein